MARTGSMVVVVVLHWLFLKVTVVEGTMRSEPALAGPVVALLTWVLMVLPLFFVAAGFAGTRVVDRLQGAKGWSYTDYLAPRLLRLVSPVLALVVVSLAVVVVVTVSSPGTGARLTAVTGNHLWFMAVYLLCVVVGPAAVRVHDLAGWWVLPAVLLGGSLLVDLAWFSGGVGYEQARWPNLVLVWLFCHQLGVLHARGTVQRLPSPVPVVVLLLAVLTLVVMVQLGPYAATNVGMADRPVSNLTPPNSALSVVGVAQLAVLTLVGRTVGTRPPRPWVGTATRWLGPRLLLVYLWHVPALGAVTFVGLIAPDVLLPAGTGAWLALRPFYLVLAVLLMGLVLVPVIAWERTVRSWKVSTSRPAVLTATVLGIAGTAIAWHAGVGPRPVPLVGVACLVAAMVLLVERTTPDRVRRPDDTGDPAAVS
ncbi:acyltransferase [Ornithinimicrobium kibberense]|uniref:Acyltransferase n=1 Tax=Ornithinimicrobium kibberense TaxID=282060 RepID=A0ABV5V3N3_9MICO|nr:acyltransferase [Ornithinimicrobium kibberense]